MYFILEPCFKKYTSMLTVYVLPFFSLHIYIYPKIQDVAMVGTPEQLRIRIEEKRVLLEQQRSSILSRRDLLRKMLAEKQAKATAKETQLNQNATHKQIEKLEQRYRQLEMNAHQMRSTIAAREGDADFSRTVGEINGMVERINQEAIRMAAL